MYHIELCEIQSESYLLFLFGISMKNIFKVTVLASAVSFLSACGQEVQEVQEVKEAQKPAYAIGAVLAKSLIAPLKRQEELGAPLDKAFIIQGIQDALDETTQLSDEELQAVLIAYDEKTQRLPTEALGAPINKSNTAVSSKVFTAGDKVKLCKSYIGTLFQKPVISISHDNTDGNNIYVSYFIEKYDEQWKYVCNIEGKDMYWAGWLADTNKWGRWRYEDSVKLKYNNNYVKFRVVDTNELITVKL